MLNVLRDGSSRGFLPIYLYSDNTKFQYIFILTLNNNPGNEHLRNSDHRGNTRYYFPEALICPIREHLRHKIVVLILNTVSKGS